MPLVNMLAMCGKEAAVVVLICDCMGHISGRKKDTEFIMEYYSENLGVFEGSQTNCFFFDGVACTTSPRAMFMENIYNIYFLVIW